MDSLEFGEWSFLWVGDGLCVGVRAKLSFLVNLWQKGSEPCGIKEFYAKKLR